MEKTEGISGRWPGGYRRIQWLRLSMVFFALLGAASHIFASPGATPEVTFWIETEVVAYVIIGVVYLFGLKMWYVPAILYTVLNLTIFFISAVVVIPGITSGLLIGHMQFAEYSFGRAGSLVSWMYLLVVGIIMLKIDKGSKINDLLKQG